MFYYTGYINNKAFLYLNYKIKVVHQMQHNCVKVSCILSTIDRSFAKMAPKIE